MRKFATQFWLGLTVLFVSVDAVGAATVTLKSGAQYEGNVGRITGLAENPNAPPGDPNRRPIVVIDDELRLTHVPYHQTPSYVETPPKNFEKIRIDQRKATAGRRIMVVGDYAKITPFDEYGRRVYSMHSGPAGRLLDVHQGITEITPTYTRIEGMGGVENPCIWDLRMATSSIPAATLRKVLMRAEGVDVKNVDARLRIVRLFIQAEMYRDALAELQLVMQDFPDLAHLKETQVQLVQLLAQQVLRDIELRRDAGQHVRVMALLESFPDKDIAAETLLRIRDMLKEYDEQKKQFTSVGELLDKHLAEFKDPTAKSKLSPFVEEIKTTLNIHTLNRMADYLRLSDDNKMAVDQKLALAVSGWLMGSGSGIDNLTMSMSLAEVRELIFKYLRSELVHEREEALEKIKTLEGGTPNYVAKLIAHMRPPIETQAESLGFPGLYELKVKGIEDQPEFSYTVQLPPEYDPWRRYPCIVTLNGGGSTELHQISWWAGDIVEKSAMRGGQASRRGYVVIAPKWQRPLQGAYEYSMREHAAVVYSLRDACRRISIDTDSVFLSGHFQGGDAAWDIALAHPDLWAGCVLIAPRADKYIKFYKDNARTVPLYFVSGDKYAGVTNDSNWTQENAPELNHYLSSTSTDCTVVLYRGRGRDREGFSDEIQRIFGWMALGAHRRNFAPSDISVVSMRPWDNYFYWLECDGFPSGSMVLPQSWPQSGAKAARTEARVVPKSGRVVVTPSSDRVTIWLQPELVDFDRPIQVAVNAREIRSEVKPSVDVMLEDVRTRADRQHPFWARVDWPEVRKGNKK